MAKYWVYMNEQVQGPYELEQLIKLPRFSRQTLVSIENYSGAEPRWISPAEIPELARIFQKVEELHDSPLTEASPRPAPKPPKPRMPARLTSVPPPVQEKHFPWGWLLLFLLSAAAAVGAYRWNHLRQLHEDKQEVKAAQTLIETTPLPASSLYSSLRQFMQTQQIVPRWEITLQPSGLYNVTLSWPSTERPAVYAFEANLQSQSVRGLNTAGVRLLAEGFPKPAAPKSSAPAPAPRRRSPGDTFPGSIDDRRQAVEKGDFDAVWEMFSRRRQQEMADGGLDQTAFIRMQKLTARSSQGLQQAIVKTKIDSDTLRWVLLRQSQPKHPDMYIKQRWVWENNQWRLDEEEKKIPTAVPAVEPSQETPKPAARPVPPNLPGLSDPSSFSR